MYQQDRFTFTAFAAAAAHSQTQPARREGAQTVSLTARRPASAIYGHRYADLTDRRLADQLAAEDAAVEAGKSPFDRVTCPAHRRWLHQCIASPQHVLPVTGHRWCRDCKSPVAVAIDEFDGDVRLTCPRCHRSPEGVATREVVRACRASLAAARHDSAVHASRLDERLSA